jgi:hypothetical protein
MKDLSSYIAAIKPNSRRSIRHVILEMSGEQVFTPNSLFYAPRSAHLAWSLLEHECQGLRNLQLVARVGLLCPEYHNHGWANPEVINYLKRTDKLFSNMRGLKHFSIVLDESSVFQSFRIENLVDEDRALQAYPPVDSLRETCKPAARNVLQVLSSLKPAILREKARMLEPHPGRPPTSRDAEELRQLLLATKLDIWGEGRNGLGDFKPGVISSRTRAKARLTPSPLGTLDQPESKSPKYGNASCALWRISNGKPGDALSIAHFEAEDYLGPFLIEPPEDKIVRYWVSFDAITSSISSCERVREFYLEVINGAPRVSNVQVKNLPHPLDLADALRTAGKAAMAKKFRALATRWYDRSPRADF